MLLSFKFPITYNYTCTIILAWGRFNFFQINIDLLFISTRENEGTERDIEVVGWDMSIPLKLFLVLGGNGSLFPQTSA